MTTTNRTQGGADKQVDEAGSHDDAATSGGDGARAANDQAASSAARRMAAHGDRSQMKAQATAKATEMIAAGIRDRNTLTDEAFYASHPEVKRDTKLQSNTAEARAWIWILHDVVAPLLAAPPAQHDEKAPAPAAATAVEKKEPALPPAATKTPAPAPAPVDHAAAIVETTQGGAANTTPQAPTLPEEAQVLNTLRGSDRRFSPAWVEAMQKKLTVSQAHSNGAWNTETLRAVRKHIGKQVSAGQLLEEKFLVANLLEGTPFAAHTAGKAGEKPDGKSNEAADRVAQFLGYKNYDACSSKFTKIELLGVNLGQGHPLLAERVHVADKWLQDKHSDKKKEEIQGLIGWNGKGNAAYAIGANQLTKGGMHTMGMAIDIDPMRNPWIFRGESTKHGTKENKNESDYWYEQVSIKARKIYGGQPVTADNMADWSASMSTEELHAKIKAASSAWEQYMQLCTKSDTAITAALRGKVDDAAIPAEIAKMRGYPATFHSTNRKQQEATGLTNIGDELLIALRDIAGLSWGGTEMSHNMNGDFMHFDLRSGGLGAEVFEHIRREVYG